jgi:GNAT superfamily N-acetyltransferase
MALDVRAVVPDDWRVLREVRLAALLDAPYAFYATFEQTAARAEEEWRSWPRQGVAFLAWLGGEPVGMVGVAASTSPGLSGDLIAMWVAPAARGTGAADALVEAAQDWARDQGWTTLDLEVAPGNERARRLYVRNGFVAIGAASHLADGLAMRCTL